MPRQKLFTSRLAQFKALGPAQRRTLLVCAVWLPVFWVGLRALGLARFHAWLLRGRAACSEPFDLSRVQELGELVNIAARHSPFPASCLTRSLLLEWLLHRRGIPSQLRIGVRFEEKALEAHAWVECEGVPVNDDPDVASHFAPFADLVPASAFVGP